MASTVSTTLAGSPSPHSSFLGPSPTTGPPQANSSSTAQASSLYLYTFLATLVLLLGVSSAVVLRSITIRVRQRRAIEEAIRNGTYIPPDARIGGSSRAILAAKPALHDAYLGAGEMGSGYGEKGDGESSTKDTDGWDGIMPVAVSLVKNNQGDSTPLPPPTIMQIRRQTNEIGFFAGLYSIWAERPSRQRARAERAAAVAAAVAAQSGAGSGGAAVQQAPDRPPAVRVAVLIAMPDPARSVIASRRGSDFSTTETLVPGDSRRPSTASTSTSSSSSLDGHVKGKGRDVMPPIADDADEETVPYLEFGVAEVAISDLNPTMT